MAQEKQDETTNVEVAEEERGEKESQPFARTFKQYADSIAALREFFSRLTPLVVEMEKGIVKEREAYVEEMIRDFHRDANEKEVQELDDSLEAIRAAVTSKDLHVGRRLSEIVKSPLVEEALAKLFKPIFDYTPSEIHRELLNKSILMSLVSYFEVLFADLAHAFYRYAPNALITDDKDKVLSVKELKQFGSIDEALRSIISDRVDKLLRESVNDWQEFFRSRMKINMKLVVPDWAQWEEYFQRRHIMVHAGGRVTERYLSNVDWEKLDQYLPKPSLGDRLTIDDAYLEHAINAFEVSGLLLCQEVWRKFVPGDSEKRSSGVRGLTKAVYRRLLSRHWRVAELLATWGERDTEAPENVMLICKFNRWLCVKRQGRWTEVEEEVKAFDCSAKSRDYAIVRASLLERADEFFELLPKALGTDITIQALKEWPILDEMRADSRFAEVIAEAKQQVESDNDNS